jgi:catechol 2,3-dioxygenase-like lactoylglutathione lyase family enzyme
MSEHPGLGSRVVTQIAIVVRDIDAAIERFSAILGVEKPGVIVSDPLEKARTTYRGQPSEARAKLAFFNVGQVDIELIEPLGEPSVWKDVLDQKGEGVHHIAFWVEDTDQSLRFLGQFGIEQTQQGHFTGGMYTYVNSEPVLGVMLELLQRTGDA